MTDEHGGSRWKRPRYRVCSTHGPFSGARPQCALDNPRLPLDPLLLRLLAAYLERQEGWELAFDPVFRPPQSLEGFLRSPVCDCLILQQALRSLGSISLYLASSGPF